MKTPLLRFLRPKRFPSILAGAIVVTLAILAFAIPPLAVPFHEYELDENPINNGTIADDKIGTLDGAYNDNGDIVAAVGISGKGAAHFDGGGDALSLTDPDNTPVEGLPAFTVAAFFKPDANYIGADRFFYNEDAAPSGGPALLLRLGVSGQAQFGINDLISGGFHLASAPIVALDPTKWYLIAGVFNSAAPTLNESKKVYLFDVTDPLRPLIASAIASSSFASNANPANRENGSIGAWINPSGSVPTNVFLGTIDDVRFYNTALTQAEIAAIPAVAATPCPGTTIQFNSASGDNLVSASDDQADDGLDNTYGSQSTDTGVVTFATPNVTVDWGSSGAAIGNGASNHWLAIAASAPFSTSNAFYTPNDPVAGTGPGTFYTTTPITLTAGNGHAARFNSITVGNGNSSGGTQQLNVEVIVDGVTQTVSAFLNPLEKAVINLCDTPAGGVVRLQINHPGGSINSFQIDDLVFAQTDCVTPPTGMIHWWSGDGHAFDIQGGANGTLVNDATYAPGKVSQAFTFNGDGFVYVGNIDLGFNFTIDAWIYPTDISNGPMIISNATSETSISYLLQIYPDGKLSAIVSNGATLTFYQTTNAVITAGSWQHVAVSYDGGEDPGEKFKFYVNGTFAPSSVVSSQDDGGNPVDNGDPTVIGTLGGGNNFTGRIDEVEIFSVLLNSIDIQNIYNAGAAGKCKPLDSDGDGEPDTFDSCPNDPDNDVDGDGVCGDVDNCPTTPNPDQADLDGDGIGDACDPDIDGDGELNAEDCAPNDPAIYHGATEVCDGLDNDCNGTVDDNAVDASTWYQDFDGDGYGNPSVSVQACNQPGGYVADNTDCDDGNSSVYPGAPEICDGVDNNCDGNIDEGVTTTFYRDFDEDGYGDPNDTSEACSAPVGYVSDNTDCDDSNPAVHPGATEICNGIDDNCDGVIDEDCPPVACYNGHSYMITSAALSWTDAEAEAVAKGGHLVTVNDAAEQAFLNSTFLQGFFAARPLWIGFTDQANDGTFLWSNGEPVTYTNWAPGEPNNGGGGILSEDYAAMNWNFSTTVVGPFARKTAVPRGGGGPPPPQPGTWNDTPNAGTFGHSGNSDGPYYGIIEIGCTPPPDNMVSWWPGDGNAHDIENGNDGTLQNGATFDAGKVDQAFSFDGSDDYVSIPNESAYDISDVITVDAWVKVSAFTSDFAPIVVKGDSAWRLQRNSFRNTAAFGTTGLSNVDLAGTKEINDGQWHHIAGVFDGTKKYLYVDGVLDNSVEVTGTIAQNDAEVRIGNNSEETTRFWNGQIDEAEVIHRALTAEQVAALYNAGCAGKCKSCTPPPDNMLSWWPGDGHAADIQDGHNGTLQGGATYAPGKVGQAFSFDGNGDYVDVGDVDLFTTFTIDAWINPASLTTSPFIITKTDQSTPGYQLSLFSDGHLILSVANDTGGFTAYKSTDPVVTTGQWQHVAATYNGADVSGQRIKLFVNGDSVSIVVIADDGGTPVNNALSTKIGIYGDQVNGPFDGLIDEVEIFTRVLAPDEIRDIADAGTAGKCKGPIRLGNISSRAFVGTSDNVEIAGFIIRSDPEATARRRAGINGPAVPTKRVLIRGRGPSLTTNGVDPLDGRLMDPVLELHDHDGAKIAENDDWKTADLLQDEAAIVATGLAPNDDHESALLRTLPADIDYTAVLRGKDANGDPDTGIGLAEVFDLEVNTDTHLTNLSTRALVEESDGVLIGGLIVQGGTPQRILLRAIGPSLPASITNPLDDPVLELHDANGLLTTNDDWGSSADAAAISATGLAPGNSKESAILFTPNPGTYTAIVTGKAPNPTGVALVEAFSLGP